MKFKKIVKIMLIYSLLLYPSLVHAYTVPSNGDFDIKSALFIEAFVSIHMSIFVLLPIAKAFSPVNSKKLFWILFAIRAAILLFCDFFVTTGIAIVDFISLFIGTFIIVPICYFISGKLKKREAIKFAELAAQTKPQNLELKCSKCGTTLLITDHFCTNCGEPFDAQKTISNAVAKDLSQTIKKITDFDPMYLLSEEEVAEEFIRRQMANLGLEEQNKLIPNEVLKRKKILNIIFSVLLCFYITIIFFHFPLSTYIIGIIILFIFFKLSRKYNFMKYLIKQVKARPEEKISNIIMLEKSNLKTDNSRLSFVISILIAIIFPLIIFSTPKILYEKTEDGYGVRFYAFGLTNFKTATIPETHNNKKVISLRGNTFSNMPFLESVKLPDTIKEIRGQAFKNCKNLVYVNIPKELEYLGGGAFYNASKIKEIELPDTLTFLGGESFYGATSLETIKLSENLTEIRGDTFEYCSSLKSITIPDKVKRIGAHAFYEASSLSEVIISERSNLQEIGSSAFRRCYSLYNISIPSITYVNERAFKESPTNITKVYPRYWGATWIINLYIYYMFQQWPAIWDASIAI